MSEIIQLGETEINMDKVVQSQNNEQKKPDPETDKKQKEIEKVAARFEKQEQNEKEDAEKAKRLSVLAKYRNSRRFGPYLKEIGCNIEPARLVKMSVKQLDQVVTDVKMKIATKNATGFGQEMVFKGIGVLEYALHDLWRIDKLSDTLRNSESFLDAVEELLLEWDGVYMSPKLRVVLEIVSTAVFVHNSHEFAAEIIKQAGGQEKLAALLQERQKKAMDNKPVEINLGPDLSPEKLDKYSNLINEN